MASVHHVGRSGLSVVSVHKVDRGSVYLMLAVGLWFVVSMLAGPLWLVFIMLAVRLIRIILITVIL